MITVPEVIEQASKELDKRGWCQHADHNSDGNVCAMGAVNEALTALDITGMDHLRLATDTNLALSSYVPGFDPSEWTLAHPVAVYNDLPTTSMEDIQLMFKNVKESLSE